MKVFYLYTRILCPRRPSDERGKIRRLNKELEGVTVFSGVEVDIKRDRSLDLNDVNSPAARDADLRCPLE